MFYISHHPCSNFEAYILMFVHNLFIRIVNQRMNNICLAPYFYFAIWLSRAFDGIYPICFHFLVTQIAIAVYICVNETESVSIHRHSHVKTMQLIIYHYYDYFVSKRTGSLWHFVSIHQNNEHNNKYICINTWHKHQYCHRYWLCVINVFTSVHRSNAAISVLPI